jgi:predicted dehydrogenase
VNQPAMRVAIVGCGLIGRKRAEVLGANELVGCFDINREASAALARDFGGEDCRSLKDLLNLDPDIVLVAVVHSELADASCASLQAGAHVLVEKPAGIGVAEIDRIASEAERAGRLVKVGFNHRFHPGIRRAVTEARSGEHGDVMFARARYGHGGRLGYEREWRADPLQSGGGEIVDQGMHLLDLSFWLFGDLPLQSALLRTHFWDAPVDDNAVLVLGERGGVGSTLPWALIHCSWTEWKNLFSLEIYCQNAKFAVDGLVRSYGPQQLRIYRMRPDLGPPDTEEILYPNRDDSWAEEWAHFTRVIAAGDPGLLLGDLSSARYAWRCIEEAQR